MFDMVCELIERFVDDALSEAVPVAILATYGRNGEKISRFGLIIVALFCHILFGVEKFHVNISISSQNKSHTLIYAAVFCQNIS
jgi:hypothetical protein